MDKINQLMKNWRHGTVNLSSNLLSLGYQKDLLKKYVQSGWLESLGYGAYKLAGDTIEWYGALKALQEQKDSNIHPGGKTALELKGYAHYLPQGKQSIQLYGNVKEKLPVWFQKQSWVNLIEYRELKLFDYNQPDLYTDTAIEGIRIKTSVPELAALEMMFEVPDKQSFDEAFLIMEGLTTLRVKLLQQLLEECNSVKAKRMFLWMAEKQNHQWVSELDTGKVYLGQGKRVIVKEGMLDKKYLITVPRKYEE